MARLLQGARPTHARRQDAVLELLGNLALGFDTAFTPTNLLYCFLGVFLGTFIGVLPGIGSPAAISMLLPVSFYLDPTTALVMLAGVYYGAE
ncbi:tripartite tricarboxylate transporter permease [Chelativorans salis]|uniref:Tripartite tricarboxylate transporter permease n=1 Tax=Chelativorans salis TaxID=2978478 RepID=A0ABT2LI08_9HYPH|nr:tripartite tricarboxylate transporter permease [Chelativorans sp. EGI FJ00035]MCT7374211.1 tripartite tricarboxylate transporter permease [Chelativorans sp. EGI FJ00035]